MPPAHQCFKRNKAAVARHDGLVVKHEGIAPQAEDGKLSSNRTVGLPADEPPGISAHMAEVLTYNPATGLDDWDTRQDWQDFWRLHHQR